MSPETATTDVHTSTTVAPVPKTPMVKRTFYIQAEIWRQAQAIAAKDPRPGGANISDIVRELVEKYVENGGKW